MGFRGLAPPHHGTRATHAAPVLQKGHTLMEDREFPLDLDLLTACRTALADRDLYWVLGGGGSGKSTVCRELGERLQLDVVDMDARIYGEYHAQFSAKRHPISTQWAAAPDGLAWLLDLSWEEFDAFNRASLPEYVDLLAHELGSRDDTAPVLVDGGVWHPTLLSVALDPARIVCLRREALDPEALWSQPGERAGMRDAVMALDPSGRKWDKFLAFDARITETVLAGAEAAGVRVCAWDDSESPSEVAERVRGLLGGLGGRAAG